MYLLRWLNFLTVVYELKIACKLAAGECLPKSKKKYIRLNFQNVSFLSTQVFQGAVVLPFRAFAVQCLSLIMADLAAVHFFR